MILDVCIRSCKLSRKDHILDCRSENRLRAGNSAHREPHRAGIVQYDIELRNYVRISVGVHIFGDRADGWEQPGTLHIALGSCGRI